MSFEYRQYVLCKSYDVIMARVVAEGMAGLSFSAQCAVLIDGIDELSHKISVDRLNLKSLKCLQIWSSK